MSIDLRKEGLIKKIKSDNTPVSNGDLEINKIITEKLKKLTPEIPCCQISTNRSLKLNPYFFHSRVHVHQTGSFHLTMAIKGVCFQDLMDPLLNPHPGGWVPILGPQANNIHQTCLHMDLVS